MPRPRGLKHSEETKRKMSKARRGKKLSEEHKRKLSESQKGKVFSEEHKRKLREARAQNPRPSPMKGRKMTSEQRARISEGTKRAWQDPEHRKKQSMARKGRAPWNKGLNAQTDKRVRAQAEKLTKLPKSQAPPPGFRYLAARLVKKRGKCWCCDVTDKRLEVHHLNGNRQDCRLQNLEILCCGCHQRLSRLLIIKHGIKIPPHARARFTELVKQRYPEYDVSKLVYINGK